VSVRNGTSLVIPLFLIGASLAITAAAAIAPHSAHAQTAPTSTTTSKSIAQGFNTSGNPSEFIAGALVSVKQNDPRSVELATTKNTTGLIGIIDKSPLIAITADSKEVQVVLSGATNVLVSNINGGIGAGDKITTSPIAGVGMKATADSQIVGSAQTRFDAKGAKSKTIKDTGGKTHTVQIGYIPLQVGVAYYQAPGSNFIPPVVQRVANSIAGRQVSVIRTMLTGLLLLMAFVACVIILYTSVRANMVSVGRNPLAAKAIRKSLYQVIVIAAVVFGASLLAGYIIIAV
jgi:hypothetical protein